MPAQNTTENVPEGLRTVNNGSEQQKKPLTVYKNLSEH